MSRCKENLELDGWGYWSFDIPLPIYAHLRQCSPRISDPAGTSACPLDPSKMARAAMCTAACLLLCACSGAAAGRFEQEDSLSHSELQAEVMLTVASMAAGWDAADPCIATINKLSAAGCALEILQSTSTPCPSFEVLTMPLACPASDSADNCSQHQGVMLAILCILHGLEHAALQPCKASTLVTISAMHPEAA